MKTVKVRVTFLEGLLGTASNDAEIHKTFIASKAPDARSVEDEVAAVGVDEVAEKGTSVFPRTADGKPMFWDYQWKGFFKDTCSALSRVPGTESGKIKAFKKVIDGCIFVGPRQIPITTDKPMGTCQRPLRAQTPQGERVALASSEEIASGATCEFEIKCLIPDQDKLIKEWLDYGELRGMGQWRNSGKGRFTYTVLE